jgi:hypothetical protein
MYSLKYLYPLTEGVNDANILPIMQPSVVKGGRSKKIKKNIKKKTRRR